MCFHPVCVRTLRVDHPSGAYRWQIQLANLGTDPTGAAVEFQLLPINDAPDDATLSTWTAGTWSVAYDSARRSAWATTPLIGAGGLTIAAGKKYRLLMRINLGSGHVPIHDVAVVHVAGSTDKIGR